MAGGYKYFYYFTAAQKIGVAVADHPTDPVLDSGKPLVEAKPEGVKGGRLLTRMGFLTQKPAKLSCIGAMVLWLASS